VLPRVLPRAVLGPVGAHSGPAVSKVSGVGIERLPGRHPAASPCHIKQQRARTEGRRGRITMGVLTHDLARLRNEIRALRSARQGLIHNALH